MEKVIVKRWVRPATEHGQPQKAGHYEESEAVLLHWGVSYEELNTGIGHYTVVWCKLPDGSVEEFHPSNIKYR